VQRDRLKKLAASMDALAQKDEKLLQRTQEVGALRRKGAAALHALCAEFVRTLNDLTTRTQLKLDPPDYNTDAFRDNSANLFQINARGRILQVEFEATPELVSTEDFRVPYIMHGAVRCFNQELLEQDLIREQLLFYTLERSGPVWRFFDARTYRTGPLDVEYFVGLMEQLV
jgi:hypothetical protein